MNNTDKDQEQVYQCQGCGQLYPETSISTRPGTTDAKPDVLYCRLCQSEALKLCN